MARSKCDLDGRWFDSNQTLDRMVTWTATPRAVTKVLKPLVVELKTVDIQFFICPDCFQKRIDDWMAADSSQRDVLSDAELTYGPEL